MKVPLISLSIFAVLAAGCSHTAKFQVVDATTKKPIEGVRIVHHSVFQDIMLGRQDYSTDVPQTDAGGIAIAGNLHRTAPHRFQFEKEGFFSTAAVTSSLKNDPSVRVFENDGSAVTKQTDVEFKTFTLSETIVVGLYPKK